MKKIVPITLLFLLLISCTQQKILSSQNHIDSDLDGIYDLRDECLLLPGSVFNQGCPTTEKFSENYNLEKSTDADLDGIPNEKDECPLLYGSPFNLGCPYVK